MICLRPYISTPRKLSYSLLATLISLLVLHYNIYDVLGFFYDVLELAGQELTRRQRIRLYRAVYVIPCPTHLSAFRSKLGGLLYLKIGSS